MWKKAYKEYGLRVGDIKSYYLYAMLLESDERKLAVPFNFTKKTEPLNLDPYFGKVVNRISLVGIELEGAWLSKKIPGGLRPEPDGSVFKKARAADPTFVVTKGCDISGEIPSRPMLPIGAAGFIRKYYPVYVDETCGMHLHWSFEDLKLYQMLMTAEFPVTVLEYIKRWANENSIPADNPLWDRLADQSKYCQHKFWPDDQVKLERARTPEYFDQERKGSRYTVINYCYKLHGTIECRILPMFKDVEMSVSAIKQLINIINGSLVALAKKQEKTQCRVNTLSDEFEEYYDIVV